MPLNLRNLSSNSATCRVDYGEAGDINITYRIANLTEKTIRQIAVLQDENEQDFDANMAALNSLLRSLVISWDLQRDGVTIPLTDEALADVPIDVRADVLRNIFEDSRMGEANGTPTAQTSPASSGRRARRS